MSAAVQPVLSPLTPQQFRVLCLLRTGLSNKEIGSSMGIAERTVKQHLAASFMKLRCSNRVQAAVRFHLAYPGYIWPPSKPLS